MVFARRTRLLKVFKLKTFFHTWLQKSSTNATTTSQPPPPSNVEKSQKLIPSYKTHYLGGVNEGASTCSGNGSRRQLALQTFKKFTD